MSSIEENSTGAEGDGEFVRYDVRDRVAEVLIDRPAASNAMHLPLAYELRRALDRAAADPSAHAVLLHGSGKLFCSGGDLAAMGAAPDRPAFVKALAEAAHDVVRALDGLEKPVVVAVQGAAAGAGFSIVLGADIVVAGESARFVTAYTTVGLTPDCGMSWLLPRVVGHRRAAELLLTSEPIGARQAQAFGIVSTVCADPEILATARAAATRVAGRPTHALGRARRLVRESWTRSFAEHLDTEAQSITAASRTDETAALIDRFLDGSR